MQSSYISIKLDNLLAAYEAKGYATTNTLAPGLSIDEILAETVWFPSPLKNDILDLYQWRNGVIINHSRVPFPYTFKFRDMIFHSLQDARLEYRTIMETYGVDSSIEQHKVDLATCFPFASYECGWYVLPCGEQLLSQIYPNPVVSVFQGVDLYYYSVESMLDTCIAWVSHPDYEPHHHLHDESTIWREHNPGIFRGW
jgi:hypothetical protein